MSTMYLVSFCHGEYDDHIKIPIVVCKTYEEAEIFIYDVLDNWNKYKELSCCFELIAWDWDFEHGQIFAYDFDIDPITFYEV